MQLIIRLRSVFLFFVVSFAFYSLAALAQNSLQRQKSYAILDLSGHAAQDAQFSETTTESTKRAGTDLNNHSVYVLYGRGGDLGADYSTQAGNTYGMGLTLEVTPDIAWDLDLSRLNFESVQGQNSNPVDHARNTLYTGLRFFFLPPNWALQPSAGFGGAYVNERLKHSVSETQYYTSVDPKERLTVDHFFGAFTLGVDFNVLDQFSVGLLSNYFLPLGNGESVNMGPNSNPHVLSFKTESFYRLAGLVRWRF